jgi:ABC-type dipeptide/oligopeptide/nickel transport system permease subunit
MEKKKNIFIENPVFTIFAILGIVVILIAILAPVITGGADPTKGNLADAILPPSPEHLFGTDKMGRDIFTRVIYGAQVSLSATFILIAVIFIVGTFLGIIAGYFGGIVDAVIMRIADMMMAFPGLVLAIAVAGILGTSTKNAIIAISLVAWPKYARLARSLTMKIRHTDYVAAATVTGSKTGYMLRKYMLPNALPTLVITAATDVGTMMMELAALSFLGFGATPPTPEWGFMLNEGRNYMQYAPWMMIYPGLAIFITVVIFNMLGDSLRDILDPKSE